MRKIGMIALVWFLCAPLAVQADVTVAAAANVQFALEELSAAFSKATGIKVKPVIGSSGKLTAQIENGAPFDVFLSADMDYPDRLHKDGLTLEGPKVYAYGSLVVWSLRGADLSRGVAGLADRSIKKIAIASPDAAPYGRQAVNAMKHYHLYPAIASKLVYGESIAQTNQFISAQAVDAGLTAKSAVLAPQTRGQGVWVDVDPQAYEPIAQGAVVLKYAAKSNAQEAQKFYAFIFSAEARTILHQHGYTLP